MTIQLNHTVVWCRDRKRSAAYLAEMLGLEAPTTFAIFDIVATQNEVSLDFAETTGEIHPQHYAFLVTETEFDDIFGRIVDRNIQHWADPRCEIPGQINTHDGGRGVYWADPDGHLLEIITQPYGSGAE